MTEEGHQEMDRPVIVIIAVHRRHQKVDGNHCCGGVCRSTPTTLGHYGCYLVSLVSWLKKRLHLPTHTPDPGRMANNLKCCHILVMQFRATVSVSIINKLNSLCTSIFSILQELLKSTKKIERSNEFLTIA